MTAREAKELTEKSRQDNQERLRAQVDETLPNVFSAIQSAARNGSYATRVDISEPRLREATLNRLVSIGYEVEGTGLDGLLVEWD